MSNVRIPFNRISFDNGELDLIRRAIDNQEISGNGSFSKKAEAILEDVHEDARVLLTPSCTDALELAARLISFAPGDEVIVPSFAFPTTVSSFVAQGATPVFCEIDPKTLGLDVGQAEKLITPKTKAIVIMHYGGVPANPETFKRLADDHDLVLVEDNAHGLGGVSGGKILGTFAAMSTLSFHETKNLTCGEGGGLVINDPRYKERAEILREKGTDRRSFRLGQVDKYTWQDLGSNWVLSDILAAVLYGQLLNLAAINRRRLELWSRYQNNLSSWARNNEFVLAEDQTTTGHIFFILTQNNQNQSDLIRHLKQQGVTAAFHYQPLHQSPFGSRFRTSRTMRITEKTANSLVRLPLYASMTDTDQDHVISAVASFSPVE